MSVMSVNNTISIPDCDWRDCRVNCKVEKDGDKQSLVLMATIRKNRERWQDAYSGAVNKTIGENHSLFTNCAGCTIPVDAIDPPYKKLDDGSMQVVAKTIFTPVYRVRDERGNFREAKMPPFESLAGHHGGIRVQLRPEHYTDQYGIVHYQITAYLKEMVDLGQGDGGVYEGDLVGIMRREGAIDGGNETPF